VYGGSGVCIEGPLERRGCGRDVECDGAIDRVFEFITNPACALRWNRAWRAARRKAEEEVEVEAEAEDAEWEGVPCFNDAEESSDEPLI